MPVLLFLLWIVLNGRITVEIVAIGMIVIALVYLFMIFIPFFFSCGFLL